MGKAEQSKTVEILIIFPLLNLFLIKFTNNPYKITSSKNVDVFQKKNPSEYSDKTFNSIWFTKIKA